MAVPGLRGPDAPARTLRGRLHRKGAFLYADRLLALCDFGLFRSGLRLVIKLFFRMDFKGLRLNFNDALSAKL